MCIRDRFINCTTRKPLFHDLYESCESYGSWASIYTPSPSNDMQFIYCTTRKPLFHDLYELCESYGSWASIYTSSPSNDMQFTNCTTRKPLFHDPYESYGSWTCIYTPSQICLPQNRKNTRCTYSCCCPSCFFRFEMKKIRSWLGRLRFATHVMQKASLFFTLLILKTFTLKTEPMTEEWYLAWFNHKFSSGD